MDLKAGQGGGRIPQGSRDLPASAPLAVFSKKCPSYSPAGPPIAPIPNLNCPPAFLPIGSSAGLLLSPPTFPCPLSNCQPAMQVLDGIAAAQPSSSLRASTHVMQTRSKAKAEQARPGDALSHASPAGMAPVSPDQEVDHQVWLGCEPSCRHSSGLSSSSPFVQAVTDGVAVQITADDHHYLSPGEEGSSCRGHLR